MQNLSPRRFLRWLSSGALLLVCLSWGVGLAASEETPPETRDHVAGEVIVKLKEGFDLSHLEQLNERFGVTSVTEVFPKQDSPQERLAQLKEQRTGLKAKEHQTWYWWTDKDSPQYREYRAKIEAEKQALETQIKAQEELIARLERRQKRAPKEPRASARDFPRLAAGAARNVEEAVPPTLDKTYLLKTSDEKTDVASMVEAYQANPAVEYAHPNRRMILYALPNDTYIDPDQDGTWSTGAWNQDYEDLWGLKMVKAVEGWEATGSKPGSQGEGVRVAVVDTGLDHHHPDIQGNIFVNPAEDINGNGRLDPRPVREGGDWDRVDNDRNGFVDDVSGWDFSSRDADPSDGHGHGTHVSGTIAAVANNAKGIAGVAPRAKVLPIKGLSDSGSGLLADLAQALRYAADMGADVINNSWGETAAPFRIPPWRMPSVTPTAKGLSSSLRLEMKAATSTGSPLRIWRRSLPLPRWTTWGKKLTFPITVTRSM